MVRRDEEETVPEKDLYSGKEGNGLSFEELDEKMQSWGRKKFGDRYARDLWRNELLELCQETFFRHFSHIFRHFLTFDDIQ